MKEQLGSAMKILGVEAEEISSFRRLGAYNPNKQRPWPLLMEFPQEYFAQELLRAAAFKNYDKGRIRKSIQFLYQSL